LKTKLKIRVNYA